MGAGTVNRAGGVAWDRPATRGRRGGIDSLYAADVWRANELWVATQRQTGTVSFGAISPPWFKEAVKAWARQRLATHCAFATVLAGVGAFNRFSRFLTACYPALCRPEEIDRPLIEAYLAWLSRRTELTAPRGKPTARPRSGRPRWPSGARCLLTPGLKA